MRNPALLMQERIGGEGWFTQPWAPGYKAQPFCQDQSCHTLPTVLALSMQVKGKSSSLVW